MWDKEKDFQDHLTKLLQPSRSNIVNEFKPFNFLNLSIDIKSEYQNQDEWRELKIINYPNKSRSFQNLWKGIGKVEIMRKLREDHFPNQDVMDILSLPEVDFTSLHFLKNCKIH